MHHEPFSVIMRDILSYIVDIDALMCEQYVSAVEGQSVTNFNQLIFF